MEHGDVGTAADVAEKVKVVAEERDVGLLIRRKIVTRRDAADLAECLPVESHRLRHLQLAAATSTGVREYAVVKCLRHLVCADLRDQHALRSDLCFVALFCPD